MSLKKSYRTSCLFHYTNYRAMTKILQYGLIPNYCKEDNLIDDSTEYLGIPMVSFCDIPLTMSNVFSARYSRHAIAFTKEWGLRNNVCPIMYSVFDLFPFNDISIVLNAFIKRFQGTIKKKGRFMEQVHYEENEWRYVVHQDCVDWLINKEEYDVWRGTNKKKPKPSDILVEQKLKFNIDDIVYIIVEQDNQIKKMIQSIRKIKFIGGNTKPIADLDKDILISKLLSMERVKRDF